MDKERLDFLKNNKMIAKVNAGIPTQPIASSETQNLIEKNETGEEIESE
jgi:hypothetical protein